MLFILYLILMVFLLCVIATDPVLLVGGIILGIVFMAPVFSSANKENDKADTQQNGMKKPNASPAAVKNPPAKKNDTATATKLSTKELSVKQLERIHEQARIDAQRQFDTEMTVETKAKSHELTEQEWDVLVQKVLEEARAEKRKK